jgi:hypothetical protein
MALIRNSQENLLLIAGRSKAFLHLQTNGRKTIEVYENKELWKAENVTH